MGLDIFITKKSNLGYFRKVNFLVKYFKDLGFNVEKQIPFKISKEHLEELLTRCNKVLENPSKGPELLPTMTGFFFGSTNYDEYYFEDIKLVKNLIENKLLKEFDQLKSTDSIYFETWY